MKMLTKEQEIRLLKQALIRNEFIAHGSSRAVYGLNNYLVLKVSNNEAGDNQNMREVEVYTFSIGSKNQELLAEIVAYSDSLVVMERVEAYDMYDTADIVSLAERNSSESDLEDYDKRMLDSFEISFDDAKQVEYVVEFLGRTNGNSYDNYQVGFSERNGIRAYDYGFVSGSSSSQVGKLDSTFEISRSQKFVENILKRKLNIL